MKKTNCILIIVVVLLSFFSGCENPENASNTSDTVVVYEGGSGSTKTILTITNGTDYTLKYNGETISQGRIEKNGSTLNFTPKDGDTFTADASSGSMVFSGPIPLAGGGSQSLPDLAEQDEYGFHVKALPTGILVYIENIPAGISQIELHNDTAGDQVQYGADKFNIIRAGILFPFVIPGKDYTFGANFTETGTDGSEKIYTKRVTVRAIGGKGEMLINREELAIIYDSETKSLRLNKEPQKGYANDPAITGWYRYDIRYLDKTAASSNPLPADFSLTAPWYLYETSSDIKDLINKEVYFRLRYHIMYTSIEYRYLNVVRSSGLVTFPTITASDIKTVRLRYDSNGNWWRTNAYISLSLFYPAPLKKNTTYKITVSGVSDTTLQNFRFHGIEATQPNGVWYDATGWDNTGYTLTKDASFSHEFTRVTKNEQEVVDYNGSYFLVFGNNTSPAGKDGDILVTISDFDLSIQEVP